MALLGSDAPHAGRQEEGSGRAARKSGRNLLESTLSRDGRALLWNRAPPKPGSAALGERGLAGKRYRQADFCLAPKETFPGSCPNVKISVQK